MKRGTTLFTVTITRNMYTQCVSKIQVHTVSNEPEKFFPNKLFFLFLKQQPPQWAMAYSFTRFLDHTHTHNDAKQSVGLLWTSDRPFPETSTSQHATLNNRLTSMPPVGFDPAIPASKRPQTYALHRAVTGIGS